MQSFCPENRCFFSETIRFNYKLGIFIKFYNVLLSPYFTVVVCSFTGILRIKRNKIKYDFDLKQVLRRTRFYKYSNKNNNKFNTKLQLFYIYYKPTKLVSNSYLCL